MSRGRKVALWVTVMVAAAGGLAAVLLVRRMKREKPLTFEGAVISQAAQADKELPLSNVKITAGNGVISAACESDSSGFFKLTLPSDNKSRFFKRALRSLRKSNQPVMLQFRLRGYWPLDLKVTTGHKLYVAKMVPLLRQRDVTPQVPRVTVSDVSVRYSVKRTTEVNVGSLVKPFQVVNTGDVPCKHQDPCSPDGKWKAAKGSLSLEAGEGNILRDARASCIAGPCPFTKITLHGFSRGRPTLSVTALDWSDTATFLVEAEVFQPMVGDEVRKSYPVIFGRVLHFTVPASAEGVCLEADIHGTPIVFPLGPSPVFQLQWADCRTTVNSKKTEVYRCELTPGYRF